MLIFIQFTQLKGKPPLFINSLINYKRRFDEYLYSLKLNKIQNQILIKIYNSTVHYILLASFY